MRKLVYVSLIILVGGVIFFSFGAKVEAQCADKLSPLHDGSSDIGDLILEWTCPAGETCRQYGVWVIKSPEMDIQYKCTQDTTTRVDDDFIGHFDLEAGETYEWTVGYAPISCPLPTRWSDYCVDIWTFRVTECGDEVREGDEECDGGDFGAQSCNSYCFGLGREYLSGDLLCVDCTIDTSECECGESLCFTDGSCDEDCPPGCSVEEDPDCGCRDDDGCCGIGCTFSNDNDCEDEDGNGNGNGGGIGIIVIDNPLAPFTEIWQLIDRFIDFAIYVTIVGAPIMLIIAGFMFVTGGGDPNKVNEAKKLLLYVVIGTAIIFLAKGLIVVIQSVLGGGSS